MSAVLLIRPGQVPINICVGLIFCNKIKDLGEGCIRSFNSARSACLLNGDNIPFLIRKALLNADVSGLCPSAVCILVILICAGICLDIAVMLIKRAAADLEVTDDDLLYAAVLGDIPEIFGSVLAEAVTDSENLESLGCGDCFGLCVAASGAGEGL